MQPYFFPYAGYFRLFSAVDQFVVFDCVQFPRRGRVHRTQVPGPAQSVEWLTLPLARQLRTTAIRDLEFAAGARATLDQRLARLGWIAEAKGPKSDEIRAFLHQPLTCVTDYLIKGLRLVARLLDLEVPVVCSSTLSLGAEIRGQDRVIAVAKGFGATRYVNPPGGRSLYDADAFRRAGIELCFLDPYEGAYTLLLPALLHDRAENIRRDVLAQCRGVPQCTSTPQGGLNGR